LAFYRFTLPEYNHPVMEDEDGNRIRELEEQIATLREDLATRVALTDKWYRRHIETDAKRTLKRMKRTVFLTGVRPSILPV
jgi:hypothetical protein